MNYKLLANGGVLRLGDNAAIPPCVDNVDWVAYQAWLDAGNVPLPADPQAVIQKVLTDGQLTKMLVANRTITQAQVDAVLATNGTITQEQVDAVLAVVATPSPVT